MKSIKCRLRAFGAFSLLFVITSPAYSGPLNGDANAIVSGTTAFNNGLGLSGTVDYAVYTYGNYLSTWGGSELNGWIPTPNEVVYAYQVYVIDDNPLDALPLLGVSQLSVYIFNPADNPGAFAIGLGDAPQASGIGPGGPPAAQWDFNPETYETSGLAFSSPFAPVFYGGNLVDGGTNASVIPLPSPGTELIPEPATVILLLAAALCGLPVAVRRFRRA